MVAKTFDAQRDFDLAEKCDELKSELETIDYETIPESVILQTISTLLLKECRKKDILKLEKNKVIDCWPRAVDAITSAAEYFRNYYRIPVSHLIPYPNLIVPFSYYFYYKKDKPTGVQQQYLEDFFWRVALGGRYSQSVEGRLAQDIQKIDLIIKGKLPKYDWAVDVSAEFIENNGWFSVGRSFIKGLLCLLAHQEPKSFIDNSVVRISNDWLKQANSKNYHHFFPRAYLGKVGGIDEFHINHIANITIVDDFLNKRQIKAQAPSKYMKSFKSKNPDLASCMKTHLIDIDSFGVFEDDYDTFFKKRCKAFSKELKKRIIAQDVDKREKALPADETIPVELE